VQLGHALKESGALNAALDAYNNAERLDGNDADLLLNLGHIHKLLGDPQSATAFYRRSAETDGNAYAKAELAHLGSA
jgi:cytochrome c-type biogenesis protein CcmH/NrfG